MRVPAWVRIALFSTCAIAPCAGPALAAAEQDPRCAIFGEGFSYVEAIGSCVRIGGLIRADAGVGRGRHGSSHEAGLGSRAAVGIEIDKETELGPFRAVVIPNVGVLDNSLR